MNPLGTGQLLTRLVEMERALEQGERRAVELRAFSADLDAALRDSGPAEIGISANAFNAALSDCRRAQEVLDVDLTPRPARAGERATEVTTRVARRGAHGCARSRPYVSWGLAIAAAQPPWSP